MDLRRGFDGLAGLTREVLLEDPLSGHLFVFRNRRADRLKILFFASGGYCLFYKRLERGTFRLPSGETERLEIDAGAAEQFVDMMLHAERFLIAAGKAPAEARQIVLGAEPFVRFRDVLLDTLKKR